MPPYITDWISSIASLVGGLAGIGALVVSILSYLKSSRALASEKETLDSVGATLTAVEALGALESAAQDRQSVVPDDTHASARPDVETISRDAYEVALHEAKEKFATAKSRVFTITCPHCGSSFGPFSRLSGGLMRCGKCGESFDVRM